MFQLKPVIKSSDHVSKGSNIKLFRSGRLLYTSFKTRSADDSVENAVPLVTAPVLGTSRKPSFLQPEENQMKTTPINNNLLLFIIDFIMILIKMLY
ncbi:hypothetical protein D3C80_1623380 [compost metagenome]